jgi:hypothetical protein
VVPEEQEEQEEQEQEQEELGITIMSKEEAARYANATRCDHVSSQQSALDAMPEMNQTIKCTHALLPHPSLLRALTSMPAKQKISPFRLLPHTEGSANPHLLLQNQRILKQHGL